MEARCAAKTCGGRRWFCAIEDWERERDWWKRGLNDGSTQAAASTDWAGVRRQLVEGKAELLSMGLSDAKWREKERLREYVSGGWESCGYKVDIGRFAKYFFFFLTQIYTYIYILAYTFPFFFFFSFQIQSLYQMFNQKNFKSLIKQT